MPFLPPTSNQIFINKRKGGRILSDKAKKFKTQMITVIQQQKLPDIGDIARVLATDPNAMFEVTYVFFFSNEDILNMSFGSGAKKAAATRYKRVDVENRLKLVSDALATATGVDDSLFFWGGHGKCSASLVGGVPQIHVFLKKADPARFGL